VVCGCYEPEGRPSHGLQKALLRPNSASGSKGERHLRWLRYLDSTGDSGRSRRRPPLCSASTPIEPSSASSSIPAHHVASPWHKIGRVTTIVNSPWRPLWQHPKSLWEAVFCCQTVERVNAKHWDVLGWAPNGLPRRILDEHNPIIDLAHQGHLSSATLDGFVRESSGKPSLGVIAKTPRACFEYG
jgi:hypothetical protein